ncbi:MAG: hypothetical protein J6P56_06170, partial [Bacteroidales bacterium]|nr:hypothetical protein [Bacteroidales bacterium]
MKKILLLTLLSLAFCACSRKTIVGVRFPEPPIEIAANEDFGMGLINYFNILQLPDGTYRMYFSGNEKSGVAEEEWSQNLYYAESADGFHYQLKGKVMDALIESSVCLVEDKEWPFRLVGNQIEDGKHCMFLWKSKDGISFTGRRQLFDFKHDTQNVLVPRGKTMKLYSRVTHEHYKNRRITLSEFTLDGDQLSEEVVLAGDFLYNNAASKVDRRYDLLFPTYYNTHGSTTDVFRLSPQAVAAGVPDVSRLVPVQLKPYGVLPRLSQCLYDDPAVAGGKIIGFTAEGYVAMTNTCLAVKSALDLKYNHPEEYWSDGNYPSAGKDYLLSAQLLIANNVNPYVFPGRSCVANSVTIGMYASTSDITFTNLYVTGGS